MHLVHASDALDFIEGRHLVPDRRAIPPRRDVAPLPALRAATRVVFVIRLGGLVWTYAQGVEFWAPTPSPANFARSAVPAGYTTPLAQREIELHGVDRLGGAVLRSGRCAAPSASAANDGG